MADNDDSDSKIKSHCGCCQGRPPAVVQTVRQGRKR